MNLNLHSTKKKENDNNNQNYTPSEITEWDDADMLHKNLLRGIYSYGFEKPSPIQRKALLTVIDGKDTIAQAQSGTGKTGTFSIGALENDGRSSVETRTRSVRWLTESGRRLSFCRAAPMESGHSRNPSCRKRT